MHDKAHRVRSDVRIELTTHNRHNIRVISPSIEELIMGSGESLEPSNKHLVEYRGVGGAQRLGNNGLHHSERVFHPVLKLPQEQLLLRLPLFFRFVALGNVNKTHHHALDLVVERAVGTQTHQ